MTMIGLPPKLPARVPCRLLLVGEAPSYEEMDRGEPLVGPSGRVENAILRTAGIERGDVGITNVFSTQLPDNDVRAWCGGMEERRVWLKEGYPMGLRPIGPAGFLRPEHLWHLERLRAEVEQMQPTVIMPLGGTALWAFTGSTAIGEARGASVAATFLAPGKKLLPTWHPAFIIKNWKHFVVAVGDHTKAMSEAEFPEVRHRSRTVLLEPTLREWRAYANDVLLRSDLISEDIETGWGQITVVSFAPSASEGICVPFVDLRKPSRSYWNTAAEEIEAWNIVKAVNESAVPKLGQNFTYDVWWFLDALGIRMNNYRHDTRLLHHALFPELPKGLGFLGARYENVGPWKNWRVGKSAKQDE